MQYAGFSSDFVLNKECNHNGNKLFKRFSIRDAYAMNIKMAHRRL